MLQRDRWPAGRGLFLAIGLLGTVGCGTAASSTDDAASPQDASPAPDLSTVDGLAGPIPFRYLAANLGNASPEYSCWEMKLCRPQDVEHMRDYIATWQPDVLLFSEVLRADQLTGSAANGPILPLGYDGMCGESRDRTSGDLVPYNANNASHEHECVAWKTARVSYVPESNLSAYGRNDSYGRSHCNYDFTAFSVHLLLDGHITLTAIAAHPDSVYADCRTEEIGRYWLDLADPPRVIIGGDWNTNTNEEIQRPSWFLANYERGQHWDLAYHPNEYSATYAMGLYGRQLDDAYSCFGAPCMNCGSFYGSADLPFGSALGGYDGHPRADQGEGMDHAQILVDMWIPPGNE